MFQLVKMTTTKQYLLIWPENNNNNNNNNNNKLYIYDFFNFLSSPLFPCI